MPPHPDDFSAPSSAYWDEPDEDETDHDAQEGYDNSRREREGDEG